MQTAHNRVSMLTNHLTGGLVAHCTATPASSSPSTTPTTTSAAANDMSFTSTYIRRIMFGCGMLHRLPSCLSSVANTLASSTASTTTASSAQQGGRACGNESNSTNTGMTRPLRPFVVCDGGLVKTKLFTNLKNILDSANIPFVVFDKVVPDPTTESIVACSEAFKASGCECFVAFGGGSSLDTAKVAAVYCNTPNVPISTLKVPYQNNIPGAPVICIPTTAGTGAEATKYAVITDTQTDEKMLLAGDALIPQAAIVDPVLTVSLSPAMTATTGLDSYCHSLEAFVSRKANPHSDLFARQGMARTAKWIIRAFREPTNIEARKQMMLGATEGGIAFSNSSVALIHGMARPLGAHFHITHGLSIAMLMPICTARSLSGNPARYAEAARLSGAATPDITDDVRAGQMLVSFLCSLNQQMRVPSPQEYGIPLSKWQNLIPLMVDQAIASGSPANNPLLLSKEEMVAIYTYCYSTKDISF
ncbi:Fe-containing alcohol dehydrogenase, mitochondrial [Pelomyxa schiedti]|nr:Fe-containing alcohol dehydrogenase, mitochondrial [Pelomyxa schiedti]